MDGSGRHFQKITRFKYFIYAFIHQFNEIEASLVCDAKHEIHVASNEFRFLIYKEKLADRVKLNLVKLLGESKTGPAIDIDVPNKCFRMQKNTKILSRN